MYKHVMKLPEPPNPAMARGTAIHKKAEDYAKGELKKLPEELGLFKTEFAALRKEKKLYVEEQWAFRSDWTTTQWNNWSECWVRIKMDAAYINQKYNALVIIDHKTGKIRDEDKVNYIEALELYSLAGLKMFPDVELVSPRLWYIDQGVVYPEEDVEYNRDDEARLEKLWNQRVTPMLRDVRFKPTPNAKCCWCAYSAAKGGPCKF